MSKLKIKLADLDITIDHPSIALKRQCETYRTSLDGQGDIRIELNLEDIQKEQFIQPEPISQTTAESLTAYRQIAEHLPPYDAFILHAAVVAVGGRGYAFLAPSGTGKSTHVALWRQAFGEDVVIVNGDKPIVRRRDGVFYAYGTPWCGKEGWQTNAGGPLAGLCFLHRGKENSLTPVAGETVILELVNQVYRPREPRMLKQTLALLDGLLKTVPCYQLWCNKDLEAGQVAYKGMVRDAD